MKMIAIVPARTSSKRLPNKNFKDFFGTPIIEWVLDEIQKSELFDKIVVSTDIDVEYDNVVALKRQNATYEQTVDDICLEVLEEYPDYDIACCVYPTAYAVSADDLLKSCVTMTGANFCCSEEDGVDNGGFYWARVSEFLEQKTLMGTRKVSYKHKQVDIDTVHDFARAKIDAKERGLFK